MAFERRSDRGVRREPLLGYQVACQSGRGGAVGKLRDVRSPELFETAHLLPQPRLFGLEEVLSDSWLKVLRLEDYALRAPRSAGPLQEELFPCAAALS